MFLMSRNERFKFWQLFVAWTKTFSYSLEELEIEKSMEALTGVLIWVGKDVYKIKSTFPEDEVYEY